MITRTDILAQLERDVRTGFLIGQKAYTPLRSAFAREVPSDGAFETYADMGSVPWPNAAAGTGKPQGKDGRTNAEVTGDLQLGGPVTVLGAEERSLIVYNRDWEITIGIEHSAINDNRVGSLEQWATSAGQRFEQHIDYLAFDALNNGDVNTKYGNCYDGLPFFNAAHKDPGAQYQTGQDNKFALSLSLDNFESVKVAAAKFLDSRGQPVGLSHNLLIVPPDLERVAAQITTNREAYDTTNREMNPYAGSIKMLVSPGGWFDSAAWVLVDANSIEKPVLIQMRQAPQLVQWDDHTQGSGIRYYKWLSRYTVTYGDWRLAAMGNS